MKLRVGFLLKLHKIDKQLVRLTKKKKIEDTQIIKIRNERGTLQLILQKLKGLLANTVNNCMPTNWKT